MMYGNQMYGQVPYNAGFNYAGMQQPPKRSNVLSDEQIATLRQKGAGFTLSLTKEEIFRGQCNHLDENGNPSYITNPDGSSTCTICGHTWRSIDTTKDKVEEAVQVILDILQTTKIMYVNMPEQASREFFQIIPMIEKIPQLYQVASDNFRSYEGNYAGYVNGNANPFALFGTIAGNQGYANAFQYQQTQPYPQQMYQQPVYGQPVYQQPAYQQPAVQGVNPFDQNAYTAQGYAPQTQGFTYNPGQPAAAPTPVAPAPAAPATAPATTAPAADVTTSGNHTP
jgi:hypothetical protein